MITRERWIIVREMEELPADVWHEYYLEKGGSIKGFSPFWQIFVEYVLGLTRVDIAKNKELSFDSAIRRLHRYYNEKFKL